MAPSSSKMQEPHDLAKIWDLLTGGLQKILNGESMPMHNYMKHYSQVYDYCTSNNPNSEKKGGATKSRNSTGSDVLPCSEDRNMRPKFDSTET